MNCSVVACFLALHTATVQSNRSIDGKLCNKRVCLCIDWCHCKNNRSEFQSRFSDIAVFILFLRNLHNLPLLTKGYWPLLLGYVTLSAPRDVYQKVPFSPSSPPSPTTPQDKASLAAEPSAPGPQAVDLDKCAR
jgi:hypothetical protein